MILREIASGNMACRLVLLGVLLPNLASGQLQNQVPVLGRGDQGENEILDEEPNGPIDFSDGEIQADGSLCVIKTKMVQKFEKQQVKECWHQNITQCHETYVTEFRPNQERQCEENFWKACKITFRETPYNYTLKTCMTPLVKKCDEEQYGGYDRRPSRAPNMVCKTWFESTCNTTYSLEQQGGKPKPQTWCSKEPRKICAPDNCRMEPGDEVCHDKTLESTVQKPEEVCDLQPQTQCHLVTQLVPHLESQTVCKEIPKMVCHLKLDHPKFVQKPVKLKWCTKAPQHQGYQSPHSDYQPAAVPSYLPPQQGYQSYQAAPPPPPPPVFQPRPSFQPTTSPLYYKSPNNPHIVFKRL